MKGFPLRNVETRQDKTRVKDPVMPEVEKSRTITSDLKTKGNVRRAKLYYLRELTGRKARISEDKVQKDNLKETKKEEEKVINKKIESKEEKTANLVSLGISTPKLGENSIVSPHTSDSKISVILAKWCCL